MSIYSGNGPMPTTIRYVVAGTGEAVTPRQDYNTKAPKLSPDNRLTFASRTTVCVRDDRGHWVRDRGTKTVNVIEAQEDQRFGEGMDDVIMYVTDGLTWITPYSDNNGRSALSITAERLILLSDLEDSEGDH